MKKKLRRSLALLKVIVQTTVHFLRPGQFQPKNTDRHVSSGFLFNIWILVAYRWVSKRFIATIGREGQTLVVSVKGAPAPVRIEQNTLREFRGVVCELYCPLHWHYYEIPETAVRADDVVLDCGSAEGLFALKASTTARRVYAVEPNPRSVLLLERTFYGLPNVTILPVGLGNKPGTVRLQVANIHSKILAQGSSGEGSAEIELKTIDQLSQEIPNISYIKADLEGYELNMLEGARETLLRNKPRMAITCYHYENDPSEIVRFVRSVQPAYKVTTKGVDYKRNGPIMLHFHA